MRIESGGGVGTVVPCVGVAGGVCFNGRSAVVYSQMQRDNTVAPHRIESGELRIESGGGVGGAMPSIAVAGGNGLDGCRAVVDGQMQRDSTVAALRVES